MTAGLILAGGQSRRMGGRDKCLLALTGRPLLGHVLAAIRPQVDTAAISANGDPDRFKAFKLPVLPDREGHAGPLAGILAGLHWAARETSSRHLLSAPCDSPFLPPDLALRLHAASSKSGTVAIASSGGRTHQVVGLWPLSLRPELEEFLMSGKGFKVLDFLQTHRFTVAEFQQVELPGGRADPFLNINTQAELDSAERLLAG